MQPGDKFHIKADDHEYEVTKDTGKELWVKDCTTGAPEVPLQYHMVTNWPRCSQCGRPRQESELKYERITFRDSRQVRDSRTGRMKSKQFCNYKTLPFCADTDCAGHYQMGCEG
jgi:hypothetical protein